MKANDLKKNSIAVGDIYERIEEANKNNECMVAYPQTMHVSAEVIYILMGNGFKISRRDFDHGMLNALVIEW